MGRYIDDILQPGEKVLYSTNSHWIFFLPAIGLWIVAAVFLRFARPDLCENRRLPGGALSPRGGGGSGGGEAGVRGRAGG